MADLTLYGFGFATYVRSARLAMEEKGVDYELAPLEMGSEAHEKLHPFKKMPILRHGDFMLFEAFPIARYIDEAFDGPALQPADAKERARMGQWISVSADYLYPVMIGKLARQRVINPLLGEPTDETVVEASLPEIEKQLSLLDEVLRDQTYFAGETYSLADMFMESILNALSRIDEGAALMEPCGHIRAWRERLADRPAVKATDEPPPL